ncbi:hypothetical protein JHD46_05145, partial [Sulfurimonas sp. SAG-AH-194-C20]
MKNIFTIGVTGHRDLTIECISYYEVQVHSLLSSLKREHTDVIICSPLSDGADRLVVKEGISLSIPFIAILPMPKDKYIRDFDNNSLDEFNYLLHQAQEIIITPLHGNNTLDKISSYSNQRDLQYEACGYYIADNSDNLIALWDGKFIGLTGGTGEIVKYYLNTQ